MNETSKEWAQRFSNGSIRSACRLDRRCSGAMGNASVSSTLSLVHNDRSTGHFGFSA